MSYYPLSLWSWQDAIKAVFLDRVNILAQYERTVRSPSFQMKLPSVVSLKSYVKPARNPASHARFNVFLRDRFECQYCGAEEDLTFDHLDPAQPRRPHDLGQCRGGVRALQPAQRRPARASGRHVSVQPARTRPSVNELRNNGRAFPPNYLHDSWADYLLLGFRELEPWKQR